LLGVFCLMSMAGCDLWFAVVLCLWQ